MHEKNITKTPMFLFKHIQFWYQQLQFVQLYQKMSQVVFANFTWFCTAVTNIFV